MSTDTPDGGARTASAAHAAAPEEILLVGDAVLYEEQVQPEHGVLGLTLRELLIVAVWLVAFVTSFFPLTSGGSSIWQSGISWILTIGVPTAAVFLIVLRRFSPDGIRRVGSLGIDQFASVAFSVAALVWAQSNWALVSQSIALGVIPTSWVNWVQQATMIFLVVLTVCAFLIPGLRDDFCGRLETLAHRNANPVRPVVSRARAASPAAPVETDAESADETETDAPAPPAGPVFGTLTDVIDLELPAYYATDEIARPGDIDRVPLSGHAAGGDTGTTPTVDGSAEPTYARRSRRATGAVSVIADAVEAEASEAVPSIPETEAARVESEPDAVDAAEIVAPEPVSADATGVESVVADDQPFWALAPTERDVVDEQGHPLFRIGPDAWALVIEDRGGAYVVRHDDGRIGYLHDIEDITKG